ncbi:L-xylulose reductase [Lecanosticta acicola]|uniref:L-xylulose reductase n=1 Tax=Lecanosticta acicola TaxID=111012 RepID=A0AAI8Z7B3_9PEZI|nr:L-xylulose reductase [Lecanosticta acicola]
MALANRLGIIVGGLGGIGSVTANLLRSRGTKLALLYAPLESERVRPVLKDIFDTEPESSSDIKAYECDITSANSVQDAFDAIASDNTAFPSILVNTAGYVSLHPFETFPTDEVLMHYNINLLGPTLTAQAFARLYFQSAEANRAKAPGGRIVNIASQAAHVALNHHGPYCASKAGLLGLTKCMASEWGPRGITANTVSPGPVMTALGRKAWGDPTLSEPYLAGVPTGQFAEPMEVARIVEFLCSDGARNVNGADVRLDGGFTIR